MPGIILENINELESKIRIAQRNIRYIYEIMSRYPERREFYEERIRLAHNRIRSYQVRIGMLQTNRSLLDN